MLDFSAQCDGSHIVGVLYSLCFKASEGSNGQIDIYNKDAIAYGRAFKDSLDIQKHGGKISLPRRMHENVKPVALREVLITR
mmetsp:Transcript_18678/g.40436  ORF Transcript_18678/g.40436 Transcript_18678/m.40436 type:complete len:82 (-) Transcript_18678:2109-2354(-)